MKPLKKWPHTNRLLVRLSPSTLQKNYWSNTIYICGNRNHRVFRGEDNKSVTQHVTLCTDLINRLGWSNPKRDRAGNSWKGNHHWSSAQFRSLVIWINKFKLSDPLKLFNMRNWFYWTVVQLGQQWSINIIYSKWPLSPLSPPSSQLLFHSCLDFFISVSFFFFSLFIPLCTSSTLSSSYLIKSDGCPSKSDPWMDCDKSSMGFHNGRARPHWWQSEEKR